MTRKDPAQLTMAKAQLIILNYACMTNDCSNYYDTVRAKVLPKGCTVHAAGGNGFLWLNALFLAQCHQCCVTGLVIGKLHNLTAPPHAACMHLGLANYYRTGRGSY